jgi:hypothetical protein
LADSNALPHGQRPVGALSVLSINAHGSTLSAAASFRTVLKRIGSPCSMETIVEFLTPAHWARSAIAN